MKRFLALTLVSFTVLSATVGAAVAREASAQMEPPAGQSAVPGQVDDAQAENPDIIMPHVMDSRHMEIPWPDMGTLAKEIHFPTWIVSVGGRDIDISPTKHTFMLLLASIICATVLIGSARSQAKRARAGKPPRGFANAIEGLVLYLRSEVVLANVGPHGEKFVPYLLTLFFFILFGNALGLVPYGATATSNIAVTATLATIAFFVVEISGMRALGARGYMSTVIFWPHEGSLPMKLLLSLIISPIEFLGKFTKPFALAIRLFANMTAGHIIVLAFIGMIFTFQNYVVAILPFGMAVAIMLLEVLVALLQAYIFTLLVSVFIGQVRSGAH
jgi:F-type H+-transporting ATPase subunit a